MFSFGRHKHHYVNHKAEQIPEAEEQPEGTYEIEPDDNDTVYDEVEDEQQQTTHANKTIYKAPFASKNASRPIATVSPAQHMTQSGPGSSAKSKSFTELTSEELVDRLEQCGLMGIAEQCRKNTFDGSFFKTVEDKDLKNHFGLGKIDILKFKKMRDENWVVSAKWHIQVLYLYNYVSLSSW